MKMRKSTKILKAIFVIPFSFGNSEERSVCAMDGSCSAVVLFTCLVSIILVVVGTFSGLHRFNEVSMKVIWVLIVTLVTIATINIFLILILLQNRRFRITSQRVETDSSTKLQLRFLWLFGIGLLLRTSLSIATDIECVVQGFVASYIASIFSSAIMIVFIISQIGLITYMQNLKFVHSSWVYFSIGIVLLANVSIWFNFAAVGIAGILHRTETNTSSDHNISTVTTDSNNNYASCFFHSKIHSFATNLKPYLFQVSLDFLLLATLFIVRTLPSSLSLRQNTYLQNISIENKSTTHIMDQRRSAIISMAFGLVLHIPFLVMALVIRFVFIDNIYNIREIWQNLVIFQKVLMSTAIFVAFSHIREMKTDSGVWRLGASDYVLLSCSVGKVVMHAFEILTATYCAESHILLSKGLISLVFYFYQTLYILISKRSLPSFRNQSNVAVFVHVLLLTLSVTQWITTTFILSVQGNFVLNEGIGCLFESPIAWKVLQYISVPFTMYYDFQSAMHYYSILPNFRFVNHG